MLQLVGWRIFQGLVTLFVISLVLFVLTLLLPGDVAQAVLGQNATPEALAAFRLELGLDKPAITRYATWLWNFVTALDFGNSLTNKHVIADDLFPLLRNTLFLATYAALLSVPLAVVTGVNAAIFEGRPADRAANTLGLIGISMPEFFVGGLLILIFGKMLGWFPVLSNRIDPEMGLLTRVWYTTLPAVSLMVLVCAHMMRMTRTSVLSVMSTPYIEMGFLKGLSRARVVTRHALPNAASPIISVVALNIAYLVVGVVVIERVFSYPGIGSYMTDAVSKRDIPVILACGMVFGFVFILLNTIADVAAILLNPRLRRPR